MDREDPGGKCPARSGKELKEWDLAELNQKMNAEEARIWATGTDTPLPDGMLNSLVMDPLELESFPPGEMRDTVQRRLDANVEQANAIRDQEVESAFDVNGSGAVCDCEPGQPCCLKTCRVADKAKANRYVNWPVKEGAPQTLYMVCKDPYMGKPSAEVKLQTLVRKSCKMGNDSYPAIRPAGFADKNERIPQEDTRKVVTPFQMPALNGGMLPPEVMTALYCLGLFCTASTYQNRELPTAIDSQCIPNSYPAVKVCPLPHMQLSASISGSVGLVIYLSQLPSISATLSGKVKGEFGNQTLDFSSEKSAQSNAAGMQGPRAKETKSPIVDFIGRMQNAMSALADESRAGGGKGGVPLLSTKHTSLSLSIALTLEIAKMALTPKSASPDLLLELGKASVTLTPTVKGGVDLLELFLNRFPKGRQIRSALASGKTLKASAECNITVTGSGSLSFQVDHDAPITIGDTVDIPAELAAVNRIYTAQAEFTGSVMAQASLDVETWLFDAHASAGAKISTGWHFGGRMTEKSDGTGQTEQLYHFEGIILRAYATASFGSKKEAEDVDGFEDSMNGITSGVKSKETFEVSNNLAEPDYVVQLMAPVGRKDGWEKV